LKGKFDKALVRSRILGPNAVEHEGGKICHLHLTDHTRDFAASTPGATSKPWSMAEGTCQWSTPEKGN
jgi:hypothetical protein